MTQKNKFIRGTLILIIANAIAKLLGAVFKIPLTYILREEGMAVYNTAFSIYVMMLSFATGGFPFALTRLLAEHTALGREDRIRPAVRLAAVILFIIGAIASAIMYIFAYPLACSMREPNAANAIRAVSASVLLVALGAVIKSSNEARSSLLPTAFSQVSEAAIKLFVGYYLASHLVTHSVYSAAGGAIFSVTVGEAFATSLLFIVWKIEVRKLPKSKMSRSEAYALTSVAVPMLITGCVSGLLNMVEISVIRGSLSALCFTPETASDFLLNYAPYTNAFDGLCDTLRLSTDGVRKLFGAYSGYAQTVYNLPLGIIGTISAAATPMLMNAITAGDSTLLKRSINRVQQLVLLLALPSAAVCFFFADELLTLLFGNSFSALMLQSLAPSMIFLCAANMLLGALHLAGKIFEPFATVVLSLLVKIVLSALLIRVPALNILGAGVALTASSAVMFFALTMVFKRNFGIMPSFFKLLAPCAAAGCVMIGLMFAVEPVFLIYFNTKAAFLLCCATGAAGYLLTTALLLKRGDTVMIIGNKSRA